MKAILKNYQQSPSKVRLVIDAVRGKNVNDAINTLALIDKKCSLALIKLIKSAINNSAEGESKLFISNILVNEGEKLKRIRPRARGSAFPIWKRKSHIIIQLETK